MQECPNCGQQNRPGVIFCENCGASLIGKLPLSTKALDATDSEQAALGVDASILTDVKIQGTATFEHGMGLRLEVEGSVDPIHFTPRAETIFGRRDPATGDKPDIDLTPFAGYRMGVSRRHAAIRPGDESGLDLWDLGSSNGTFLNGQRLSAHRPYRLRDGDEIRLGQMLIRLYFESEAARTPIPPSAVAAPETPEAPAPAASEAKPAEPETKPAAAPAPSAERPTSPVPPPAAPDVSPAAPEAAPIKPGEKPAPEAPAPSAPAAPEKKLPPAPKPDEKPAPEPPARPDIKAASPAPAAPEQKPAAPDERPAPEAPAPSAPVAPEQKLVKPGEKSAPRQAPPVPTTPDAPSPAEPALPAEPSKPAEPPSEPKPSPGDDKSG